MLTFVHTESECGVQVAQDSWSVLTFSFLHVCGSSLAIMFLSLSGTVLSLPVAPLPELPLPCCNFSVKTVCEQSLSLILLDALLGENTASHLRLLQKWQWRSVRLIPLEWRARWEPRTLTTVNRFRNAVRPLKCWVSWAAAPTSFTLVQYSPRSRCRHSPDRKMNRVRSVLVSTIY